MVVLLVGIMTIIQLFPTGFRVIRAAESQTMATKLAEQELERWKNMAANLPDGVLAIGEDGTVLNNQYPGPPFSYTDSAGVIYDGWVQNPDGTWQTVNVGGVDRYKRGNAFNIRRIVNESTDIPVGSYFSTGGGTQYGSRYTLAFSPIDVQKDSDGNILSPTIKSGDLRRIIGDATTGTPSLSQGQYAIDYSNGGLSVAFPKDPDAEKRTYYLSYSYWAVDSTNTSSDPVLFSVIDQEIDVPKGDDGSWKTVPLPTPPTPYSITEVDPSSDSCARGFEMLDLGENWNPNDPYEFKLPDEIIGIVAFNPIAHGLMEHTGQGLKPIRARIDYLLLDSRIIREDRTISDPVDSTGDIPVKLSLRFILKLHDQTDNPNEFPDGYPGLLIGADRTTTFTESTLAVDLATGLRVLPHNGTGLDQCIDFVNGIVNLPQNCDLIDHGGNTTQENVPMAGRHVRFYYRADGDWSVQCQKAYSTYVADRTPGNVVDYRHFRQDFSVSPNRLWFAQSEAGKTVSVDYTYSDGSNSSALPVERKVVGEMHKISEQTDSGSYSNACFIDLSVPGGWPLRRVTVVGTSFRVRVVWRDGKAWRHVDMDTNLVSTSQ